MFGRTPYEALKDTGLPNPEKLITFPIMILEEQIETIRKTVEFLLYKEELKQIQDKIDKKLSPKQIINTSIKYSFFDHSAQKALSKYPH
ncbi:MAG: hypothetical protein U9O78_01150 [Patescibacteria group bacterium]|nr:hypothetical protein [Patescibacteria group bacterium]